MGTARIGRGYKVARAIGKPLTHVLWRIKFEGLENLPAHGGAVLCPNHVSFLDSAFLLLRLPRQITFVGKAEYMDSWQTKYLFPAVGMIPIDRSGGDSAEAALSAAQSVLEKGQLFGIFPEGTRSRSGLLYKGHTGAARLALRTGSPIIPIGVVGTREIQPPDAKMPRPFKRATIKIGVPINVDRHRRRHGDNDPMLLRSITDELMFQIRELTDQTYVHEYATKKAEALPAELAKIA